MGPSTTLRDHASEEVILAGGCFWGVQELVRKIPGVIETKVGYSGGTTKDPTYETVSAHNTGHAEAVKVLFAPSKLTFESLLDHFFALHDPTTLNRQGNDVGEPYRSAIFYTSDTQRAIAERKIKEWSAANRWGKPLTTEVTKAGSFWPAEEEHQDYLKKHPHGYTCHFYRKFK